MQVSPNNLIWFVQCYHVFPLLDHPFYSSSNAARATVRMLGSLIRLAQGVSPFMDFPTWPSYLYNARNFNSGNVVAHARLMFRNEVTRLDAITAILCIESSMTTSAIVDSVGNALHSNFTENPDQECWHDVHMHGLLWFYFNGLGDVCFFT